MWRLSLVSMLDGLVVRSTGTEEAEEPGRQGWLEQAAEVPPWAIISILLQQIKFRRGVPESNDTAGRVTAQET